MIFHLTKAIRHLVVHSFVFKGAIEGKEVVCMSVIISGWQVGKRKGWHVFQGEVSN